MSTHKKLKKELGLFDVFAIATGTTLSGGFFLMPGLAASEVGSAMIISYLIVIIPLIPAMLCVVELTTAMPRSGGVYFFLDRSLGPYFGTIGGIGTWLTLILKVSFALVGMGAYIALFFPEMPITPTAVTIAIIIGAINLSGAKKAGKLQQILVIVLLAILGYFIIGSISSLNSVHYKDVFTHEVNSVIATAGLVYISYAGITKVASLAEEVKKPERNLPLGIFLAMGLCVIIYTLGTIVMVGVIPPRELTHTLTPVALAAEYTLGMPGKILLSVAALSAFISVANAGTLSASRYPLAMSRDHIITSFFSRLGKNGSPINSIVTTVSIIVLIIIFLDPMKIAKLASAFQLLMFALVCFVVIIMRESHIKSYDPTFKSPFYPWLPIFGFISPFFFIVEMGIFPIVFSLSLILFSTLWYVYYTRFRVSREGAIYHLFERVGTKKNNILDQELREIIKAKGLQEDDPYNIIIARSLFIDIESARTFESIVAEASIYFAKFTHYSNKDIETLFLNGTLIGVTPVSQGVALPHLKVENLKRSEMVLVRSKKPIKIAIQDILHSEEVIIHEVHAIYFLLSPKSNPRQHLRILAKLAEKVDSPDFMKKWQANKKEQDLKDLILNEERCISLEINDHSNTSAMIGKKIKYIPFPDNCFIVQLQRGNKLRTPDEETKLKNGDILTIIGDPVSMQKVMKFYF